MGGEPRPLRPGPRGSHRAASDLGVSGLEAWSSRVGTLARYQLDLSSTSVCPSEMSLQISASLAQRPQRPRGPGTGSV